MLNKTVIKDDTRQYAHLESPREEQQCNTCREYQKKIPSVKEGIEQSKGQSSKIEPFALCFISADWSRKRLDALVSK
jgi:hypothetical protein